MQRTLSVFVLCSMLLTGCIPVDHMPEAWSLGGEPLEPIAPDPSKLPELQHRWREAEAAWRATPTEQTAIDYGRADAALGRYRFAVDDFSYGLARFPDSYRLLRHRAHRYITVRKLDKACDDSSRAWALVRDMPDAPESADGSSTDKSAILYHWGLAEYLRGEYRKSDEVFAMRSSLPTLKDENVVSAAHWHYWALRRQGRDAEAARVVAPIRNGMDVQENKSYYTLCRLYRGLATLEEVERQLYDEQGKLNAGLAYGVACWQRYELKDDAGATSLLRQIIATGNWPAFGYIAAEADLASRGS